MQKHGLEEIKSTGEKFDPMKHEIAGHENNAEKENNIVLEELQKGYTLKGRLLRPAKVRINKKWIRRWKKMGAKKIKKKPSPLPNDIDDYMPDTPNMPFEAS